MTDSTDTISGAEDRRSNQNRRVSIAPAEDDNRSGADRRQGGDRRGHFVNLMISDDAVIQDIFKWLIDNAGDNWTIGPNDNEPPESPVTCRVRFENEAHLEAFTAWLNSL